MNKYILKIYQDVHGDITGLTLLENDVVIARNGYENGRDTRIETEGNWTGPLFVIYNALLDGSSIQ